MLSESTAEVATSRQVLAMEDIHKSFGSVAALTGASLEVNSHEVVALVGDNGAGKSTMVKILAGVHGHDAGGITFDGKPVEIPTPMAAIHLGIATVFQDLALCENLTVVGNLFLGSELRPAALDEVAMEVRSWELLRQLSAKIPSVRVPVASLSGGQHGKIFVKNSEMNKGTTFRILLKK